MTILAATDFFPLVSACIVHGIMRAILVEPVILNMVYVTSFFAFASCVNCEWNCMDMNGGEGSERNCI